MRTNRQDTTDYHKKWYKENRTRILEKMRKRRKSNAKEISEYGRQYRKENKEKIKVRGKVYYAKNKDRVKYLTSCRHDRRRGHKSCTWEAWQNNIVGHPCVYCGYSEDIGADRIENTRGHEADNISPCCKWCNKARMDHFTVEEMLETIGPAIRLVRQKRASNITPSI